MPSMLSYPRRLPSGHITCYLNRTYHVLTTRCLISIDISPYVRLVWLRAQTPGMLDFYSAFVWAWLQPTRPSSLALALDWSTCTEAQVCATRLHRGVCAPRVHNDGQPNPKLRFDRAGSPGSRCDAAHCRPGRADSGRSPTR